MALSLDHVTHTHPPSPRKPYDPQSVTQQTLDSHLHTIRAHLFNFANRFYDKPFTLIVDPSARAGATGEHSPCDALVPSIVSEYAIVDGVDEAAFSQSDIDESSTTEWERLDWVADDHLRRECAGASTRALNLIKDSDDSVLWFEGYGTDWIKGVGKFLLHPCSLSCRWYLNLRNFQPSYRRMRTSKWLFNLLGTRRVMNSRQRTRRC